MNIYSFIAQSSSAPPRIYVQLDAYWGNGDVESSLKISSRVWKRVQDGGESTARAWGWYEGKRFSAEWSFANGAVSIDGEDGAECIVDFPIADIVSLPDPDT